MMILYYTISKGMEVYHKNEYAKWPLVAGMLKLIATRKHVTQKPLFKERLQGPLFDLDA